MVLPASSFSDQDLSNLAEHLASIWPATGPHKEDEAVLAPFTPEQVEDLGTQLQDWATGMRATFMDGEDLDTLADNLQRWSSSDAANQPTKEELDTLALQLQDQLNCSDTEKSQSWTPFATSVAPTSVVTNNSSVSDPTFEPENPVHATTPPPGSPVSQGLPPLAYSTPIERIMSGPMLWSTIIDSEELRCLLPGQFITSLQLDFTVLAYLCGRERQGELFYLPTPYLPEYTHVMGLPTDEEKKVLVDTFDFSEDGEEMPTKICFIARSGEHFFSVFFDYEAKTAIAFGRAISALQEKSWAHWNGPVFWDRIGAYFDQASVNSNEVSYQELNWHQNGYDCGPTAFSVLTALMANDQHPSMDHPPAIPCGHLTRIHMFEAIRTGVPRAVQKWSELLRDPPVAWHDLCQPVEGFEGRIAALNPLAGHHFVLQSLLNSSATCADCQVSSAAVQVPAPGSSSPEESDDENAIEEQASGDAVNTAAGEKENQLEADSEGGEDEARARLKAERAFRASVAKHHPLLCNIRDRNAPARKVSRRTDQTPVEVVREPRTAGQHLALTEWGALHVRRFARPTPPPEMQPEKRQRWLPVVRDFDEYESGPRKELFRDPSTELHYVFSDSGVATHIFLSPWTMFRDYGWRILSSFCHMFHLQEPIMVLEHVLAIGLHSGCEEQVPDRVRGAYTLGRHNQTLPQPIQVSDQTIVSLAEMLTLAPEAGTAASQSMFLKGKLGATPIYVNPELDGVPLPWEDLNVTYDLDSLVWVGKRLKMKRAIQLCTGPTVGKAPIDKNNHVYVDILAPQLEDSQGPRSEWLSKTTPLSSIPHVKFGSINGGLISIFLFFPRMIHRQEHTGRRQAVISYEMQTQLWDKVLLPIFQKAAHSYNGPYVPGNVQEVLNKTTNLVKRTGDPVKAKPSVFSPIELEDVMNMMEDVIGSDPLLSRFGSYFFVLQSKGIKLWTKGDLMKEQNPFSALLLQFPEIDWEYVFDRTNGELVVDIGVAFNPIRGKDLVGLWRLDKLEASFGAGGFNLGQIHHAATLSRYGGVQAEMAQDRARHTHISFRSAYNLAYEVVRNNTNHDEFCKDRDAYFVSRDYRHKCKTMVEVLSNKASRVEEEGLSFGCRDEYRLSGQAAIELMKDIHGKAMTFYSSSPILWIPKRLWFRFQSRRIDELYRAQVDLSQARPRNYATITGVLSHLLRCVSGTPIVKDSFVRESLKLLDYSGSQEMYGMFFLPGLDISDPVMLPGIIQSFDCAELLKAMGITRQKRLVQQRPGSDIADPTEFPLGYSPTWKQVREAFATAPWKLLKQWRWDGSLYATDPEAQMLFIKFTQQIWRGIDNQTGLLIDDRYPRVTTLKEAVELWTYDGIARHLTLCEFVPINAGLKGAINGARALPFSQQAFSFFPDDDQQEPSASSTWAAYYQVGYISSYRQLLEQSTEHKSNAIRSGLAAIFSQLQCLPKCQKPGINKAGVVRSGFPWKCNSDKGMFVVVNPSHYRIVSIGKNATKVKKGRSTKVWAKTTDLRYSILELEGIVGTRAEETIKAKKAHNSRSAKTRNKRVPPPPRPKRSIVETQLSPLMEIADEENGAPEYAANTKRRQGKGGGNGDDEDDDSEEDEDETEEDENESDEDEN